MKTAADISLRVFTIVHTLLSTGMRTGEFINATRYSINIHLNTIFVYGKTGLRRRPLVSGLEETLNDYFKSDYYLQIGKKSTGDHIFFSKKNDGSPLTERELNSMLKEIAKKAGIKKRHYFLLVQKNICSLTC